MRAHRCYFLLITKTTGRRAACGGEVQVRGLFYALFFQRQEESSIMRRQDEEEAVRERRLPYKLNELSTMAILHSASSVLIVNKLNMFWVARI